MAALSIKRYERFKEKLKKHTELHPSRWSTNEVIGYVCAKYRQHYGFDYTFRFNAPPSKCYETYRIKQLTLMLSKDGELLKSYIDHVFAQIGNARIGSIFGYLTKPELVHKYKWLQLRPPERSTPLPPAWVEFCASFGVDCTTYGELAFARLAYPTMDARLRELESSIVSILENIK